MAANYGMAAGLYGSTILNAGHDVVGDSKVMCVIERARLR